MSRQIRESLAEILRDDRRVQLGLLLYLALAAALAFPLEAAWRAAIVRWIGPFLLVLLMASAVWSPPFHGPAERRFWRALGISWMLWSLAILLSVAASRRTFLAPAIDVVATLSYLAYVVGIESTPHREREEWARSLEGSLTWAVTLAFGLGLLAYFVLPSLLRGGEHIDATFLLSVGFESYLTLRILQLFLLAGSPRWRVLYGLLALSALSFAAADLLAYFRFSEGSFAVAGGPQAVLWLTPFLPALMAARLRLRSLPEEAAARGEEEPLAGSREQLLLLLLLFPAIHLLGYGSGLFDAAQRPYRDLLVAGWLIVLGGLTASLYRRRWRQAHRTAMEVVRVRAEKREQEEKLALYADLEAMKDRYEKIFHTSPDAVSLTRVGDDRIVDVNEAFEQMTGFSREEVLGKTRLEIGMIDATARDTASASLSGGGQLRNCEVRMRRKDGSTAVSLVSTERLQIDGVECFLVVSRDVTELSQTQDALRHSEERFAKSFHANPNPAVITTLADGRILEVNPAACELSGFERHELIGKTGEEIGLWTEEHGRKIYPLLVEQGGVRDLEILARRRDGEVRQALTSAALVELGGQQCVVNVVQDVTDRRQLEIQLQRAQRLESIGTLAGGIAHDLNNVLTPMLMAIQLMRVRGPEERILEVMEGNTRRGAALIRQIMTFARGAGGERTSVAPEAVVREVEGMMRQTFPKGIELTVDVAPGLPTLLAESTQLHQLLLNLCVNARDALQGHGHLRVAVHAETLSAADCARRPLAFPGTWVVFEVADDGPGMAPEVCERIFDPFFTTKEPGEGTGLGLFTVRSVAAAHDGSVELESAPGEGACFRVYLPCQLRPANAPEEDSLCRSLQEGRGELVLFVDDEEAVREVAASVLRAFGYRVHTAADGSDALAAADLHGEQLAVALVDLAMPGIDGFETIRELRRRLPQMPILAMSGSLGLETPENADGFLRKPFHAEALLDALQDALAVSRAT